MDPNFAAGIENLKARTPKSQSSTSKRRVFKIVQKNFATVGITPSLVDQSYPLNGTISFAFLMLASAIYCTFVFIAYDAETFADYTQSAYTVSIVTFILLLLLASILKAKNLFEFINGCGALVNTSAYECIKNILYANISHGIVF